MTLAAHPIPSLAEFLELDYIDEAPHWEYVDGNIIQKPRRKRTGYEQPVF
jgi:Uma2 family endonuclease